jgi:adenine/guanine phosphoribosyltransferase-like PRPP-binding protein
MKLNPNDSGGCAHHLKKAFYNRHYNLKEAYKILKGVGFDTIVCTGISGIVFASPLSILMKKQLAIVRKVGDRTHSYLDIEANFNSTEGTVLGRYIIVDDLTETGKTIKRIKAKIKKNLRKMGPNQYVGSYFYTHMYFDTLDT